MAYGKNYEGMYAGGYSSFNPDSGGYVGFRINAGTIGSPTSIQTANQISEVVSRIKEGVKNVEIQTIQPDVFDQIPREQFKEIAALSKLTGVRPSLHSPIIDPVGFSEKGNWEGELARKDSERRLFSVIEKSHALDPKGNVPVVIHSGAIGIGNEYRPGVDEKGKEIKPGEEGRFKIQKMYLIDPDTGDLKQVKEEKRFYPAGLEERDGRLVLSDDGKVQEKIISAESYGKALNRGDWDNRITNMVMAQKEVDLALKNMYQKLSSVPNSIDMMHSKQLSEEDKQKLSLIDNDLTKSKFLLDNVELSFVGAFDRAWKSSVNDPKQREALDKISRGMAEEKKKIIEESPDRRDYNVAYQNIKNEAELYEKALSTISRLTDPQYGGKIPQAYKPVEEFAREKSAETFSAVALKSYKTFGESSPIMAVENMFQGFAFAKTDDMVKLIKDTRDKFVEKACKSKADNGLGMSKGEAEEKAKKFIGATWDVGHLNMMKKAGFTDEDVINETKKIAKMVKHVHLTDNFGYSDSHLPPGMGNVPLKGILEQLEKEGKINEMRKIVEAGGFVQHFKKSPHPYVLSAFGSSVSPGVYWNQVSNVQGSYFGFPLAYLPEKHFSMYGSGFSSLPEELGGQIPGSTGRFSGTPAA